MYKITLKMRAPPLIRTLTNNEVPATETCTLKRGRPFNNLFLGHPTHHSNYDYLVMYRSPTEITFPTAAVQ